MTFGENSWKKKSKRKKSNTRKPTKLAHEKPYKEPEKKEENIVLIAYIW